MDNPKLTLTYLFNNQVLLQKFVSNIVVQNNLFVNIAVAEGVWSGNYFVELLVLTNLLAQIRSFLYVLTFHRPLLFNWG